MREPGLYSEKNMAMLSELSGWMISRTNSAAAPIVTAAVKLGYS